MELFERFLDHDLVLLSTFNPIKIYLHENNAHITVPPRYDNSKPPRYIEDIFPDMQKRLLKFNPAISDKFNELVRADKIRKSDCETTYNYKYDKININENLSKIDAQISLAHELAHSAARPYQINELGLTRKIPTLYQEIPSICTERKMRLNIGCSKNNVFDKDIRENLRDFTKTIYSVDSDYLPLFLDKSRDFSNLISYYFGALYSVLLPPEELDNLHDKTPGQFQQIAAQIMENKTAAIDKIERYLRD